MKNLRKDLAEVVGWYTTSWNNDYYLPGDARRLFFSENQGDYQGLQWELAREVLTAWGIEATEDADAVSDE